MLEKLGLRVLQARPYEITAGADTLWILDFDMVEDQGVAVDVVQVKENFQAAFARIWSGAMESDGFNRLVLGAGLNWREVVVLRAYCKYLLQARAPFSQAYMEQTDFKGESYTPNELIHHLLKAPVDLLWNGGIGTYIKAVTETQAEVGDKANDALRVNGRELRCKVVGEGGNLGFTQRGRIEYALAGGKILTDAIDNSGGVNCSDHEVNIKILLDQVVRNGDLTEKQRNQLLVDMTGEVAELVLRQNYLQPQAIGLSAARAVDVLGDYARLIRNLEKAGKLDRVLELLPADEALAEREAAHQGLTPPEIAVLLAYSKIDLYQALLASDVPEDPYLKNELLDYFPKALQQGFSQALESHPLRREIIATHITNSLVDRMGASFTFGVCEETGASYPDIARAYTAAREMFDARRLWSAIEALDNQAPATVQSAMLLHSRRLLERACLWLLRHRRPPLAIKTVIGQFSAGIATIKNSLPELLKATEQAVWSTGWS